MFEFIQKRNDHSGRTKWGACGSVALWIEERSARTSGNFVKIPWKQKLKINNIWCMQWPPTLTLIARCGSYLIDRCASFFIATPVKTSPAWHRPARSIRLMIQMLWVPSPAAANAWCPVNVWSIALSLMYTEMIVAGVWEASHPKSGKSPKEKLIKCNVGVKPLKNRLKNFNINFITP